MRLGAGASVLAVVSMLAACGPARESRGAPGEGWQPVAGSPLSARQDASVSWVGDRFVVVGGDDGPPCPPHADCAAPTGQLLRDGATFDPATGAWEPIAEAPVPVAWPSVAVVGEVLYLLMDNEVQGASSAFLAYDRPADLWTTLPMPPDGTGRLVPVGGVLLAVPGSDEHALTTDAWFDPATTTWHRLPDDPLGPSFDRSITVVDDQIVLSAHDLVPSPGAHEPSLVRLAELDPTLSAWTVLAGGEVIGSDPVAAAGRLVFPDVGGADGGEIGNWGRTYPYGGIYDPASGAWSDLPDVPGRSSWPRLVVGDLVRVGDVLLDPVTGTTTPVPDAPWSGDDSPSLAASPDSVFAWGGMQDRSTTGYLFTP
ncbi:hypothetical protein [uncultured Cellulomonas sp.]|uniref:hypothetical protein n=1 Tax=uncultured Cellulomonas sp. TaxID=189682 RepID=UPI0028EA3412|nr:hypothetical protein [uncultured Cellulomonas sp.]